MQPGCIFHGDFGDARERVFLRVLRLIRAYQLFWSKLYDAHISPPPKKRVRPRKLTRSINRTKTHAYRLIDDGQFLFLRRDSIVSKFWGMSNVTIFNIVSDLRVQSVRPIYVDETFTIDARELGDSTPCTTIDLTSRDWTRQGRSSRCSLKRWKYHREILSIRLTEKFSFDQIQGNWYWPPQMFPYCMTRICRTDKKSFLC